MKNSTEYWAEQSQTPTSTSRLFLQLHQSMGWVPLDTLLYTGVQEYFQLSSVFIRKIQESISKMTPPLEKIFSSDSLHTKRQ